MNQTHYTRERLAGAHQHELEREAARERLAESVERPRRGASTLVVIIIGVLMSLAIVGALLASGLLDSGWHVADALHDIMAVWL